MEELETQAKTDPLTGYITEISWNWLQNPVCPKENFSIAFLDLDKFKNVNVLTVMPQVTQY